LKSLHLPASLKIVDGGCLGRTGVSIITVEEGNSHLRVSDYSLMYLNPVSLIQYFGIDSTITLNRDISMICARCFYRNALLSSLTFESDSKLTRIEGEAFWDCQSLKSILIPSSMTVLCKWCFRSCTSLSSLTFEESSKLVEIEYSAFEHCTALTAVCIPSSLQFLRHSCFASCKSLRSLTFQSGSALVLIEADAFR
jgi:hypothetical protein